MQSLVDVPLNRQPMRRAIYRMLWWRPLKAVLEKLPLANRLYRGWQRIHPFDIEHGIEASGYMPADECARGSELAGQVNPYGGSQPSVVRASLSLLPDLQRYAFVDLGCGKGRPLVVASEFPFQRVVGVELAPPLADIARENARIVAAAYPDRTGIDIEVGDATMSTPPADCVVYFLYNPFDETLIRKLINRLELDLQGQLRHAFFVYYNPVHSAVLDQSKAFARWSAQTIPYATDELGYGPDIEDTVLIWQSLPPRYPSRIDAGRAVTVGPTGWTQLVDTR
ncbi:MAG: class I SAM-dependent methyltransferase [Pseudomonadota bacterium]|nr:class I SAM-dependent methyltransferase [Pseudomonadota bacterium]